MKLKMDTEKIEKLLFCIIILLGFIVNFSSDGVKEKIVNDPTYPKGIYAYRISGHVMPNSPKLEVSDRIGFVSTRYNMQNTLPYVFMNQAVFDLGIMELVDGSLPKNKNEVLAFSATHYALGDVVRVNGGERKVVGIIGKNRSGVYYSEATLSIFRENIVGLGIPVFFSKGNILQDQSSGYSTQKLSDHIINSQSSFQKNQENLRIIYTISIVILFMVYKQLNILLLWLKNSDELIIRRTLGNDKDYFRKRWFNLGFKSDVYVVLASLLLSLVVVRLDVEKIAYSIIYHSVIILVISTFIWLFGRYFALIPIKNQSHSHNLERINQLMPSMAIASTIVVIVVSVTGIFHFWQEHIKNTPVFMQEDVKVVSHFAEEGDDKDDSIFNHCLEVDQKLVKTCIPISKSNFYLWSMSNAPKNIEKFSILTALRPEDMKPLGLQLVSGRWPKHSREVLINTNVLKNETEENSTLDITQPLELGFKIVGVVKMPYVLSNMHGMSFHKASVIMLAQDQEYLNKQVGENVFASPLGEVQTIIKSQLDGKGIIKTFGGKVEIFDYSRNFYELIKAMRVSAGNKLVYAAFLFFISILLVIKSVHLEVVQNIEKYKTYYFLGMSKTRILRMVVAKIIKSAFIISGIFILIKMVLAFDIVLLIFYVSALLLVVLVIYFVIQKSEVRYL